MRYEELSSMAQAILDNVDSTAHVIKLDFESKVSDYTTENSYLECIVDYIENILCDPRYYLEVFNLDGKLDLSYFVERVRGLQSGILQVLSIPVSMRNLVKEDID